MTRAALKQPIHKPNKTFNISKTLLVYFSCITITTPQYRNKEHNVR